MQYKNIITGNIITVNCAINGSKWEPVNNAKVGTKPTLAEPKAEPAEEPLKEMTKAELLALAEAKGIDGVNASMNKAQIIAIITE